jgi:hypothetical protein
MKKPVGYTVVAVCPGYEEPICLSRFYISFDISDLKRMILEAAFREGFVGTIEERLTELNWYIVPLFLD